MSKAACIAFVFLLAATAAAEDDAAPSAPSSFEPGLARTNPAPRLHLPPIETFRLFPQTSPETRVDVDVSGASGERRLFHQAGDPDSVFTLGTPTPGGELHLKASFEVNEIFLKAIPPDPLVQGSTRPRAAGSFLPVDTTGRPYQLRLGARLVW
jgi:hypothetical protein